MNAKIIHLNLESTESLRDFHYTICPDVQADGLIHLPTECADEAGYGHPVRFTPTAYETTLRWDHHDGWPTEGRAYDALLMGRGAAAAAATHLGSRQSFTFKRVPNQQPRGEYRAAILTITVLPDPVTLAPTFVFLTPGEDLRL
jgi:hypothetical protein